MMNIVWFWLQHITTTITTVPITTSPLTSFSWFWFFSSIINLKTNNNGLFLLHAKKKDLIGFDFQ